jgi:hypothetical protein
VSYKELPFNKALDHVYVDQNERRSQSLDFKASLWLKRKKESSERRPLTMEASARGTFTAALLVIASLAKHPSFREMVRRGVPKTGRVVIGSMTCGVNG